MWKNAALWWNDIVGANGTIKDGLSFGRADSQMSDAWVVSLYRERPRVTRECSG